MKLVLPAPHSPNSPIVQGVSAIGTSAIRSASGSVSRRKPSKSSAVGTSLADALLCRASPSPLNLSDRVDRRADDERRSIAIAAVTDNAHPADNASKIQSQAVISFRATVVASPVPPHPGPSNRKPRLASRDDINNCSPQSQAMPGSAIDNAVDVGLGGSSGLLLLGDRRPAESASDGTKYAYGSPQPILS